MILRPYQEQSIESLRDGFRKGHKRQVLAASTGAGKSVVMKAMIKAAVDKGSRVLFLCERRVLVEQFSAHLDEINIDHGVLMAKHKRFKPHKLVQVASVQTIERMEEWPSSDIIFIDELHAILRKSLLTYLGNRPDLRVIGSTATPFHPKIPEYFTSVTSVITMRELVNDGNLVPFKVFSAKEIDTKGVKTVGGEWEKSELETRGRKIVGDVVSDYIKLSNEVFGGYRKTICFSSGIAHGADLAQQFNEAGINAVQISSDDTDVYKKEVLDEFSKPDTSITMLISVGILERGFDSPAVEHVILARPLKKSFSSHVQQVGRGARPFPGKEFAVIQDHSGNWLRFYNDWQKLYNEGVKELANNLDSKPRKEPTQKEKKEATCPSCSHFWPPKTPVCTHCGFAHKKKNEVEVLPGVLEKVADEAKAELADRLVQIAQERKHFYEQLLYYCDLKGYSDGWAHHKYLAKYGVKPTWPKALAPVTADVMRWITHQNIKFAKRAKKSAAKTAV